MQRTVIILAYLFFCATCFAQQYPFVHYTPKDGLISNQIKNIYQDSKGRLYFTSVNGLSVYDGSRFINYTSKNGLNYDIVNCVMEMGDDSVWVVTNSNKINCLVNGRLKTVTLKDTIVPIINLLIRDDKGVLYAATDQGLFLLDKDHFIKLPFIDTNGKDANTFITHILPFGDYLLIQRDKSMLLNERFPMYLYNKVTKKITAQAEKVYSFNKSPDGRLWVSKEKNLMSVDTAELKKGKIVFEELPQKFANLKNLGKFIIFFDPESNGWISDQSNILLKVAPNGNTISFTPGSGLSMFYINTIFMDKEGITWFADNSAGVNKLVQSNFSILENPFGVSSIYDISFNENKNELLLYSIKNATVVVGTNNQYKYYKVKNANEISRLFETPHGLFGTWQNNIYKLMLTGNTLHPQIIFSDSTDSYGNYIVDKNGNIILCGSYNLTAIVNARLTGSIGQGKTICKRKINSLPDQVAVDNKGNIWIATRAGELIMYQVHPDDPSNYLEQKRIFLKELSGFSPRSIAIDKNDNIWIGSRANGIYVFSVKNEMLTRKFHLTTASGLSDNFTTNLTCDQNNNIWVCSALGLDMISVKNGTPVIENLTKQNNIYQSIFEVVIDKNNTAWGLVSNGLIKITHEKKRPSDYSPTLMVTMIKAGKDTMRSFAGALSYKQNNLSFFFAGTSFLDEKQVLYSYRLHGGGNNPWSEPSNNASVSFIDLPPGDYTLDIKANFPAGRYSAQIISYKFSIAPPWWQTWWSRSIAGLLIIGLIIIAFRLYYRRKLEKQKVILEKQQAIEKERTRIATDMHDDLGAGLSRIKFLSETIGIKKQQQEPIEEDINKIREYSHEMIDKMGEIVWALNEKNDSLSDLLSYTRAYTMEYLSQNGIDCKTEMPDSFPSVFVSGEFRRNVFLTIKEALHNVVKHSQATEVKLTIKINHHLSIKLKDNGIGFDKNNIRLFSNGLSNMESRVKEIRGKIEITNKEGTFINLSIPLNA